MKGIVFGGKGFLGKRIAEFLGYHAIDKDELDIFDDRALATCLDKEKPEVIINSVAWIGEKSTGDCDTDPNRAWKTNVDAAVNLALKSVYRGIHFVHLSTGDIYFGDNNGLGWKEEDLPNFFETTYAKTKIETETIIRSKWELKQLEKLCLVIRPRFPVDEFPHAKNLIDKISAWKSTVDIKNSMTAVPDMLFAVKSLLEKKAYGVYNLTNPGAISFAEIAEMYKQIINPAYEFQIVNGIKGISSRRGNCILNTEKLQGEGIILPEIHLAVANCMKNYKENQELSQSSGLSCSRS